MEKTVDTVMVVVIFSTLCVEKMCCDKNMRWRTVFLLTHEQCLYSAQNDGPHWRLVRYGMFWTNVQRSHIFQTIVSTPSDETCTQNSLIDLYKYGKRNSSSSLNCAAWAWKIRKVEISSIKLFIIQEYTLSSPSSSV